MEVGTRVLRDLAAIPNLILCAFRGPLVECRFSEMESFRNILYNRVIAAPRGKSMLSPAPPPRIFAQGMAATFMLLAGLALISGWMIAAWILEAFLVIAIAVLLFGKFCLGAYVYHLLRGNVSFANSTLPWAHP
jgi:Domain of unknown function (DUF4395)